MTDLGRHRHTRQAAPYDPEQDHASSLHPEGKIGAAPRGAVGPASAGGLGLDSPPAARRAIGKARVGSAPEVRGILLTRLLTTGLDKGGRRWNCPVAMGRVSGPYGQGRPDLDEPDLATDQKVGGSSPSERAHVFPGRRASHASPCSPSSSSDLVLALSASTAATVRPRRRGARHSGPSRLDTGARTGPRSW
jgi:hypothetical protein